jgi:hypothetical protein
MELIMGMFTFCMGLLIVLGTVGHIEQSVSIHVSVVAIQLLFMVHQLFDFDYLILV